MAPVNEGPEGAGERAAARWLRSWRQRQRPADGSEELAVQRAHEFGLSQPMLALALLVFAGYAAVMGVVTGGAEAVWGSWAVAGYGLAALAAWRWRGQVAPLVVGLIGALVAPAALLPNRGPATAEVSVVVRSAFLLVEHGSPYLPTTQLLSWQSYNPYLPAMSLLGLPRVAGLTGALGDPRLWLTVLSVGLIGLAFSVAAPHGVWQCRDCRRAMLLRTLFAVVSPVFALPLTLGVTDPPVIALVCLALACTIRPARATEGGGALRHHLAVARRFLDNPAAYPLLAGLAIGGACAMKATAWPALPVIAVMLLARDGARVAARFVATAVLSSLALVFGMAPALLTKPSAAFQNIVAFPLGISRHLTPAASPLPGHVLASTGPVGHLAAIGLLLAAAVSVGAWLLLRPPPDVRSAGIRLAVGLVLMFGLAPDARFGYFAYPAGVVGWLLLTRRVRLHRRRSAAAAAVPVGR